MKIYAYLRVSTDHQIETGHGLLAQKDACNQWATSNNQKIEKFLVDEGVSGAKEFEKRPALFELLSLIGKGDILLVSNLDRIGREEMAVSAIEAVVQKKGSKIVSVAGEGTNEEDELSAFIKRKMTKFFAEYQRMTTVTRTRAALQAKIARGEQAGHLRKGYRLSADGIHLEEDEEEQRIIRIIKEYRRLLKPYPWIANKLNQCGVTNRGKPWTDSAVRYNDIDAVLYHRPLANKPCIPIR